VLLRERAVDREQLAGSHDEPTRLEPVEDLPGQAALDGVRLDQDESPLHGHGGAVY
jgi:hypothetical protein